MQIKDLPVTVKAGPDDGLAEGQFEAYASVFGNKDSYGDVVMPGAFAESLTEWAASGAPIPLLWGHDMKDPFANIGHVLDASEDAHGLRIKAQLDLEGPTALQVYRLLKAKRVGQMSFAYDVLDGGEAKKTEDDGSVTDYYELRRLKLYEVSVVPIGANQETEILAVKADRILGTINGSVGVIATEIKEGRVLGAKHLSSLKDAHAAIGAVIAAADIDSPSSDDGKGAPAPATNAGRPETPASAAADQAAAEAKSGTAQAIARLQLATL